FGQVGNVVPGVLPSRFELFQRRHQCLGCVLPTEPTVAPPLVRIGGDIRSLYGFDGHVLLRLPEPRAARFRRCENARWNDTRLMAPPGVISDFRALCRQLRAAESCSAANARQSRPGLEVPGSVRIM